MLSSFTVRDSPEFQANLRPKRAIPATNLIDELEDTQAGIQAYYSGFAPELLSSLVADSAEKA